MGDTLAGTTSSCKRFGTGPGLVGMVTKRSMLDFWGNALMHLPMSAATKHVQCKTIVYNRKAIVPSMVRSYVLAAVSYSGTGKYNPLTRVKEWVDLPDVPELATSEEAIALIAPPQHSWWPVTMLSLYPDAAATTNTACGRLVICFYQWLDDTPQAWLAAL